MAETDRQEIREAFARWLVAARATAKRDPAFREALAGTPFHRKTTQSTESAITYQEPPAKDVVTANPFLAQDRDAPECLVRHPNAPTTTQQLHLGLDELYMDGYYYTHLDIGGGGHSITIEAKDKEEFLDEFARIWREKAEKRLVS